MPPTTMSDPTQRSIDPWFAERGSVDSPVGRPGPARWMIVAGVVAALLLLGWFYLVLDRAVAQAHTHWASAVVPVASEAAAECPPAGSPSGCLHGVSVNTADVYNAPYGMTTALLSPAR